MREPNDEVILLAQRNVQFSPGGGRSWTRSVRVKDLDEPMKSVGMTLQGQVVHVHWADGFNRIDVQTLARLWWPAATEVRYD